MSARKFRVPESSPAEQSSAFNKCLVEPDRSAVSGIRRRRLSAVGASAFLEIAVLAALLIWPLFATGTRLIRREYIPIPPYGGHRVEAASHQNASPHSEPVAGAHRFVYDDFPTPGHAASGPIGRVVPGGDTPPGFDFGPPTGPATNLISIPGVESGPPPPAPEPPKPAAAPIRRSEGVQSALLIRRIEPSYPPLAIQARREGTVQIRAIIARDGSVESLEVLSGDPLFIQSSLEAVRQWRYRPTLLGGEPVEVDTYITVNFRLAHDWARKQKAGNLPNGSAASRLLKLFRIVLA
jgi:TonB family protein